MAKKLRTYDGWLERDRQVLRGEKASDYSVVDGQRVALFKKKQTKQVNSNQCWDGYHNDGMDDDWSSCH